MGLLQKLKSVLGLNGTESSGSGPSGDVDVTVEREPSTESEDAVKGTETASSGATAADTETAPSEPDDTESDEPSADEFEPLADETDEADETEEVETEETAEADETEGVETPPVPEEAPIDAQPEPEAATEPDTEAATETVDGSTDPVTELNGIGPAYGDRLAGVGIETVGELAAVEPADVAEQTDLGESRVAGWVEQANEY